MTSTHQQQTDNDWRYHAACRTVDPELFYPHRAVRAGSLGAGRRR